MTADARAILGELIDARVEGSARRAARLLQDDVRYWDCEHGDVDGRRAVAELLTATPAWLELETVATQGDAAVAEIRVDAHGTSYRSTEVYALRDGAVAGLRAYHDPAARRVR